MFVNQKMITNRLQTSLWMTRKNNFPIGLHSMPKCKSRRFAGVGYVNPDGADDPKPFFDLYVGDDPVRYRAINEMVRVACEKLGKTFIDMT